MKLHVMSADIKIPPPQEIQKSTRDTDDTRAH